MEVSGLRPGVRLGVDVGSVRVGVARSDASATLAVPVETVRRGPGDIARIVALAGEHQAIEVLVGLPLGMDGRPGAAAGRAVEFAQELAAALPAAATGDPDHVRGAGPIPIRLVDERLSTVSATRDLQAAGRNSRTGRGVVDQAAAVVIVTYALDRERATGLPCGQLLQERQ